MCGIVGYVGFRKASSLVIKGLERLEYRGYDSSGLATVEPSGSLQVNHSVGRVRNLSESLTKQDMNGNLGLGHTRWATHGRPSLANTHPHTDCSGQVAVVHNGIVENFLGLKRDLLAKGHIFTSDTDTEVIAHLIDQSLADGEDFEAAFLKSLAVIQGANAVAAIWEGQPDMILGARIGYAGGLVVSHKDGETFLASDLSAMTSFSDNVVFLDDSEVVVASSDGMMFKNLNGESIIKKPQILSQRLDVVEKGGYRHFMMKEIMEQPQAVISAMRGQIDFNNNKIAIENFPFSESEVKEFRRVIIVGCGTSFHAAMVGRNWIEELSGLPVETESASEFRYRNIPIDEHTLVVAIAQSGETADTLAAMDLAKSKGGRLLTICNVDGSQADRMAEGTLFMRTGLEIGVASTKTFVASMCLMALLSLHIGRTNGFLSEKSFEDSINHLARLPNILGNMLSDHSQYSKLGRWLQRYEHVLYLGRGSTYPIALEGALKLKEISYVHAEGYASGEMKHGPIALIDDSMLTIALAPKFRLYEKMVNNIKEVKARDGVVLAIATDDDMDIASQVDFVLYTPKTPELLIPFVTLIPLQLLAYYAAVARGCDVDQPRNLAKSVTVE